MHIVKGKINIEKEKVRIIYWIRDWYNLNYPNGKAIIGISGGKDSYIVAKLCVEALGKDRVYGVLMPNGIQKDIADSLRVVEDLGIEYTIINIEHAYNGLIGNFRDVELKGEALVNIPPRLRMTTLYAVSAALGGVVTCNGNLSESLVGYTTIYGDLAGAFAPIVHLYVHEVVELGLSLGLIPDLIEKVPADGLSGSSDEDKLGFKYKDIYNYFENVGSPEYMSVSMETRKLIDKKHDFSEFKRTTVNIPQLIRIYQ